MNIKIYQINTERDKHRVAFMASNDFPKFTGSNEVDSSIYDCAYKGDVDCNTLEEIYQKFNLDHPNNYKGRSLSVSDVVEVVNSDNVENGFYYCDDVGYKKILFEPEKAQPLKNKNTITVVLVEPNKYARIAEIGTELSDLQKVVGGCIETFYPYEEEVCLVCDDEGKLNGKTLNRAIYNQDGEMIEIMAGTFFICDCSGERFGSLSKEQQERYLKQFKYPEHFIKLNEKIFAVKYEPQQNREDAR